MTLIGKNEERSSDDKGLVHLDVATTSAATTIAEKLKGAVDAEVSPSNPLTREHFGFIKVNTVEEKTILLGLYQGLLIHLPNPPCTETVQGWQEKTKIAGGIYDSHQSQHGRGWYFNWCKYHQHFVDQTYVDPHNVMYCPSVEERPDSSLSWNSYGHRV
ncbi:hypothetical protein HO173_003611 [Letharia columbiana]|uniref:Uncharacterized protein n=1 Tax=Letharia columbiana TaxID=112416 RepID=A0A8H6G0M9_9LECA|nr:uncharacterized protein HO173_003611 [Letharia columbiana]KAF6238331.1 hypothetical protein HO173_003611 [Letharia columbiana]